MQNKLISEPVLEAFHGGLDADELAQHGIDASEAIDFSSNVLPSGPSESVRIAVQSASLDRYPDRECRLLRNELARRYNVDAQRLLIGNGCSELIHLIATALLSAGDSVLIVGPTFAEYERASRIAGGAIVHVDSDPESEFAVPVDKIEEALDYHEYAAVWICNPNNPTGQSIASSRIEDWMMQYPQTMFIIDESYIEFAEQTNSLIGRDAENLVVLRSMTKAYSLAGVRLGFAWLSSTLLQTVVERRVPWTVSSVAQAAGIAVLRDPGHYECAMSRLHVAKRELMSTLTALSMRLTPSDTGFFLLHVDDAIRVRESLLEEGMVVRDCQSFGLTGYLRIAVLDQASNQQLSSALARLTNPKCDSHLPSSVQASSFDQRLIGQSTGWDDEFRDQLARLFRSRRDVRRFRNEPIPSGAMERWIQSACLAPSVGLSQPWRFVSVDSPDIRAAVIREFEFQNELASRQYDDETAKHYRQLKLAGLREAPEQLAVFIDDQTKIGRGLGCSTMPETLEYSVVAAIQNIWLAARAEGVGIGWVSIMRPEVIPKLLQVPSSWRLLAYLCLGFPETEHDEVPELEREGWEKRMDWKNTWCRR